MDSDITRYGVVLVSAGERQEAEAIASALVSSHLAACVTLIPVRSIFSWQGELHNKEEWQLVIKTDLAVFPTLESLIRELHSDEVPEILALPIVAGSGPYLQWISDNVSPEKS